MKWINGNLMDKKMSGNTTKSVRNSMLYQTIFSSSPDLAYILDKHCALIACNTNLLKFLNITSIKDEVGVVGSIYKLMVTSKVWTEQQARKIKNKDIETILSAQEYIDQPEMPIIEKDNTIHHFISSRIPILDKKKNVQGLLVIIKEITKYVEMEEQLANIRKELKRIDARTEQAIVTKSVEEIPQKILRMLIIEDSKVAQQATQSILMQIDCIVETASSEAELNKNFQPGKYDMIFMDIGLEETSGYMLAKLIRTLEQKTDFHVPIIALTTYNAENITYDCSYYEMEGAISKPLTVEQARQLIQCYIFNIDIPVTGLKKASNSTS